MSMKKGAGAFAARQAAVKLAPSIASGWVRTVLEGAIDGVGPIRPSATSAEAKLVKHDGDIEAAITSLIRTHTTLAGAEGFVTNLGGITYAAISMPANITGLALIKCHLVAGIAHLRGYDLSDPRVRNAVLACMLGRDTISALVAAEKLPSTPIAIATAPSTDPLLDELIAREVTTELVGAVTGRRLASLIGRRVPLLGGAIGASGDSLSTYLVGKYAREELHDRRLFTPIRD